MKALTIWQPWATLILLGVKHYETRSWAPRYRGLLAIHAGLSKTHLGLAWASRPMREAFHKAGLLDEHKIPLGAVIGTARLVEVLPIVTPIRPPWGVGIFGPDYCEANPWLTQEEQALGNYAPGRFAWRLEVVDVFSTPIPQRGAQGFWDWEPCP